MSATPTSTAPAFRTLDGVELPHPGDYAIDPAHTHAGFVVRHMKVAKVRGQFGDVAAAVHLAQDPEQSRVEVTIQAASIDTRNDQRDEHLRSPDFLDVANHPTLTFVSTGVANRGGGRFEVAGDLTVRGVTRPVSLDLELEGVLVDPWGNERFGVTATTTIDRETFGLTWNQALEAGGVLVGKQVRIEIEAEAVRQ